MQAVPGVRKLQQLSGGRFFEITIICLIAIGTIAVKGANGEGQSGFFNSLLSGYIEETSVAFTRSLQGNALQFAEANSLVNVDSLVVGHGGQAVAQSKSIELAMVQDSSVVAHTPVSEDYLDSIGFRRNGIVDYEVQEGDMLAFIASDFGVTINSIRWANGLKGDTIRPGQKLRIPPVSGVIHTVKIGDSVTNLAKKYGVTNEVIIAYNVLPQDGRLSIGDDIIVPDGVMVSPSTVTKTVTKPSARTAFSYLPDLGSYFSWPTIGFNWGKIHGRNGIDIANSCGTSITAAAGGTVTVADDQGWNGGFGKFIKISHENGTETLYAHATKLLVKSGQTVAKGSSIAVMGTTGRSTGCHLHFEVHGARNPLAKY